MGCANQLGGHLHDAEVAVENEAINAVHGGNPVCYDIYLKGKGIPKYREPAVIVFAILTADDFVSLATYVSDLFGQIRVAKPARHGRIQESFLLVMTRQVQLC
jgi:hypothetical protein